MISEHFVTNTATSAVPPGGVGFFANVGWRQRAALLAALLRTFSLREWRLHFWRTGAAVVAVALGVALAYSVQLINASALGEFSLALRSVQGEPDLQLRASGVGLPEAWYERMARDPRVAVASPMLEINSYATALDGQRQPIRVLGIDALLVAEMSRDLMPEPQADQPRLSVLSPGMVFLNPSARSLFGTDRLQLQLGLGASALTVAGAVSAGGNALAVMDIGAAQDLFGRAGQLSRVDLRLRPGVDRAAFARELRALTGAQSQGVLVVEPSDDAERVAGLSRAYRVNLSVLALVALFTGAFLVYSVLALSVAQRARHFALLGVLGLGARDRLALVLAECTVIGVLGSAVGVALGAGLAALALRVLGGDLGGGYFEGVAPTLRWSGLNALAYAALGVAAALGGGFGPARAAARLPPAQTLKGLGTTWTRPPRPWIGPALMLAGALLAMLPPVGGIALAAYLAIALLLLGGIATLPMLIGLLYPVLARAFATRLLPLLAVERARRDSAVAAVAVGGVVAALALAVALTVMVASFRQSMTQWLDQVLPADLYLRLTPGPQAATANTLPADFIDRIRASPQIRRVVPQRVASVQLSPRLPAVALIARPLDAPDNGLPLLGRALPTPAGAVALYVSEAVSDLYGARPGSDFTDAMRPTLPPQTGEAPRFFIAGVWRDYARQHGAIAIDLRDYQRLWQDPAISELALWLADGVRTEQAQQSIRALADDPVLPQFSSARELRVLSLRLFDRSFAVTYWLQAVAVAIGLAGVAASFSAQVLSRRKEFGLLSHLGFTRRQTLALVAGEGAAWTAVGALGGLALGLAVSVVLVDVVNPQSFHWTMDLTPPWLRLLLLCLAVIVSGSLAAWFAGRSAAAQDAVRSVKEDW